MGGKTWSVQEEQVFWEIIVPQSPHPADPNAQTRSWAECAVLMGEIMGDGARRSYTGTGLYEHHYQNTTTGHRSPKAVMFVEKYLQDCAYFRNSSASSTSTLADSVSNSAYATSATGSSSKSFSLRRRQTHEATPSYRREPAGDNFFSNAKRTFESELDPSSRPAPHTSFRAINSNSNNIDASSYPRLSSSAPSASFLPSSRDEDNAVVINVRSPSINENPSPRETRRRIIKIRRRYPEPKQHAAFDDVAHREPLEGQQSTAPFGQSVKNLASDFPSRSLSHEDLEASDSLVQLAARSVSHSSQSPFSDVYHHKASSSMDESSSADEKDIDWDLRQGNLNTCTSTRTPLPNESSKRKYLSDKDDNEPATPYKRVRGLPGSVFAQYFHDRSTGEPREHLNHESNPTPADQRTNELKYPGIRARTLSEESKEELS